MNKQDQAPNQEKQGNKLLQDRDSCPKIAAETPQLSDPVSVRGRERERERQGRNCVGHAPILR